MSDLAFWLVFATVALFDLSILGALFTSERVARLINIPGCVSAGVTTSIIFRGCVAGTLVAFPWVPTIVLVSSQIPFGFWVKVWIDDLEDCNSHLMNNLHFWSLLIACFAMILVSILLKTASV